MEERRARRYLVGLCMLVAILVAYSFRTHLTPAQLPQTLRFAYSTGSAVHVINGNVITTVDKYSYGSDPYSTRVVWTSDSKYVAMLSSYGGFGPTEVIAVEPAKGKTKRFACPDCVDIIAQRDSSVLVSQGRSVRVLDVSQAPGSARAWPGFELNLEVPADHRGYFVASRVDGAIWHTTPIERNDPSFPFGRELFWLETGEPPVLSHVTPASGTVMIGPAEPMLGITSPLSSGHREALFVGARLSPGLCLENVRIYALSPLDLQLIELASPLLPPAGLGEPPVTGIRLRSLWWGADQNLHGSFVPVRCVSYDGDQDQAGLATEGEAFEQVMNGGRWVHVGTSSVVNSLQLDGKRTLLLRAPACFPVAMYSGIGHSCPEAGAMSIVDDGNERIFATGVLSIITPPRPAMERPQAGLAWTSGAFEPHNSPWLTNPDRVDLAGSTWEGSDSYFSRLRIFFRKDGGGFVWTMHESQSVFTELYSSPLQPEFTWTTRADGSVVIKENNGSWAFEGKAQGDRLRGIATYVRGATHPFTLQRLSAHPVQGF